ncbi:hypothetical protein [Chitinophaga sp. CF118]|uniref:hypothetical protein n=1 Tax=Chitinophaga sp. CF118 TaxID=1884367 RepID=UPI000B7ED7CE|nr:hypothetical protein [Chitinophaga sp. CF118]
MRVINFRLGNRGVSIKKNSKDRVIVRLKNDQIPFILKEGEAEPVTVPPSLDNQLLTHLKWAITHYFGCKKND